MIHINNDRPIALYNCEKKELIGLFKSQVLVSMYLYKERRHNIYASLKNKWKMKNTVFDFPVAARWCNNQQVNLLGSENYKILNGYYEPHYYQMKQFDFCKAGGYIKGGKKATGIEYLKSTA